MSAIFDEFEKIMSHPEIIPVAISHLNILDGFSNSNELRKLVVGLIEKMCMYEMSDIEKEAFVKSIIEQQKTNPHIGILEAARIWHNSPVLKTVATKIRLAF